MADVVDRLNQISEPPSQKGDFDTWLNMGSALDFLRGNAQRDEFVVYALDRSTFIHSILAPASSLDPPDIDDLTSHDRVSPRRQPSQTIEVQSALAAVL